MMSYRSKQLNWIDHDEFQFHIFYFKCVKLREKNVRNYFSSIRYINFKSFIYKSNESFMSVVKYQEKIKINLLENAKQKSKKS